MVRREDLRVKQQVYFGRPNGQKTLGEVVKLNPTKARVKTLEVRGGRTSHGEVWNVPYSLLYLNADGEVPSVKALKYSPFDENNKLYEALADVYGWLSPENLTGDGEAPRSYVVQRSAELHRKIKGITMAIGHAVSEDDLYAWEAERRKANSK